MSLRTSYVYGVSGYTSAQVYYYFKSYLKSSLCRQWIRYTAATIFFKYCHIDHGKFIGRSSFSTWDKNHETARLFHNMLCVTSFCEAGTMHSWHMFPKNFKNLLRFQVSRRSLSLCTYQINELIPTMFIKRP